MYFSQEDSLLVVSGLFFSLLLLETHQYYHWLLPYAQVSCHPKLNHLPPCKTTDIILLSA